MKFYREEWEETVKLKTNVLEVTWAEWDVLWKGMEAADPKNKNIEPRSLRITGRDGLDIYFNIRIDTEKPPAGRRRVELTI